MHDDRPPLILDNDVHRPLQRSHVLLIEGVHVQHGDNRSQIIAPVRNAVDHREPIVLRADPERGAEPRLTSFRQLVQVEDGLVKGLQEGVLVIAENLVPVLIQQVQPGHPLILGEHVGQNVLLEPLLVPGLIIRMELSQKPGGLSQDLHIPELLGEVEGQILGHRPGRDQKVLLLLGDHHLCVCVIGVIDRKQQGAQQAGQQSCNQHLGRFPPSESHRAPPPFCKISYHAGAQKKPSFFF